MTDTEKALREALDAVERHPEFTPGQWEVMQWLPEEFSEVDARFCQVASPAAIRALLAEVEALRRDAERDRAVMQQALKAMEAVNNLLPGMYDRHLIMLKDNHKRAIAALRAAIGAAMAQGGGE